MNILYDETEVVTREFCYKVNGGGELNIKIFAGMTVKIVFQDKKFQSVQYNDSIVDRNRDTKEFFLLMSAIGEKIKQIESDLNAPQKA